MYSCDTVANYDRAYSGFKIWSRLKEKNNRVFLSSIYLSKFHKNPSTTFGVILLKDRWTNANENITSSVEVKVSTYLWITIIKKSCFQEFHWKHKPLFYSHYWPLWSRSFVLHTDTYSILFPYVRFDCGWVLSEHGGHFSSLQTVTTLVIYSWYKTCKICTPTLPRCYSKAKSNHTCVSPQFSSPIFIISSLTQ